MLCTGAHTRLEPQGIATASPAPRSPGTWHVGRGRPGSSRDVLGVCKSLTPEAGELRDMERKEEPPRSLNSRPVVCWMDDQQEFGCRWDDMHGNGVLASRRPGCWAIVREDMLARWHAHRRAFTALKQHHTQRLGRAGVRYTLGPRRAPRQFRHEDRPKFVPLDNVKWKSGMPSSEFYWRLGGGPVDQRPSLSPRCGEGQPSLC